jgi:hypothetical protein
MALLPRVKEIGRWLNRMRFKTLWQSYMDNALSYGDYKFRVLEMCNDIRKATGVQEYNRQTFDDGWQWLTLASADYKASYDAMVNLIYGWW